MDSQRNWPIYNAILSSVRLQAKKNWHQFWCLIFVWLNEEKIKTFFLQNSQKKKTKDLFIHFFGQRKRKQTIHEQVQKMLEFFVNRLYRYLLMSISIIFQHIHWLLPTHIETSLAETLTLQLTAVAHDYSSHYLVYLIEILCLLSYWW